MMQENRRERRASRGVLVLLVATLTATAGCAASPQQPAPSAADPDAFTQQQLRFGPCDPAVTGVDDERVECATLEVPLDYSDPGAATASLGVSRIRATGEDVRGSVIVNPGGPGAPALGFVSAVADSWGDGPGREHLDLVAMDPRGVGSSAPAIDCYTDAERDDDAIVSGIPAGALAWSRDDVRATYQQCAERTGGEDVLAQMGTRNVARDLDVLRAVLGDDELSFLGASYGTRLGAVYADAFPERVRALVLDGAVDPRKDVLERQVQLFTGVQRSFDQLAQLCAEQVGCPLGDDPDRAVDAVQALLQPLVDEPLPTADGRTLTFFGAVEGITLGLYSSDAWASIIAGLQELQQGRGDVLLALRDASAQRGPAGAYTNSSEATFAINCLDEIQATPDETTAVVERMHEVAPYLDPGVEIRTRYGCEGWPSDTALTFPYGGPVDAAAAPLVVSVTGDGLTPHEGGIALAERLDARLLTVDGEQHGATTSDNACVDDLVQRYLVDLELPAGELRCAL